MRAWLLRHFDGINTRDYERWRDPPALTASTTVRTASCSCGCGSSACRTPRTPPVDLPIERICWRVALAMTGTPPRIDVTRGGSSVAVAC
ncbi:MAG: hypothetical protein ACR2GH_12270 [Pseudonocardia sp.]